MNDEEVFATAIELPHEKRVGFLDGVYLSRPHDRAQMEAMLAAHERGDSLLDAEHLESTEDHQAIDPRSSQQTPKVHDTIGNYKLLQKIRSPNRLHRVVSSNSKLMQPEISAAKVGNLGALAEIPSTERDVVESCCTFPAFDALEPNPIQVSPEECFNRR